MYSEKLHTFCKKCKVSFHKQFQEIHSIDCKGIRSSLCHPYVADQLLVSEAILEKEDIDKRSKTKSKNVSVLPLPEISSKKTPPKIGSLDWMKPVNKTRFLLVNEKDLEASNIRLFTYVEVQISGQKEIFMMMKDENVSIGFVKFQKEGASIFPVKLENKKVTITPITPAGVAKIFKIRSLFDEGEIAKDIVESLLYYHFKNGTFSRFPILYAQNQIVSFPFFNVKTLDFMIEEIVSTDVLVDKTDQSFNTSMTSASLSMYATPQSSKNVSKKSCSPKLSVDESINLTNSFSETYSTPKADLSHTSIPDISTLTISSPQTPDVHQETNSSKKRRKRHKKKNTTVCYELGHEFHIEIIEGNLQKTIPDSPFWYNKQYRNLEEIYEKGISCVQLTGNSGVGKNRLVEEFSVNKCLPIFSLPVKARHQQFRSLYKVALKSTPCIFLVKNLDHLVPLVRNRIFEQFSNENNGVFVMITTEKCIPKRPSMISFGLMTPEERFELLWEILSDKTHEMSTTEVKEVAKHANSFTCEDLVKSVLLAELKQQKQAEDFLMISHLRDAIHETSPNFIQKSHYQKQTVLWSDIYGYEDEKQQMRAILARKKNESNYQFPGILLYGPPGCSKTMLVKALVTESKYSFFPIRASDLLSKYVGDTEKNLSDVFEKAKRAAPSIVFLDELDNLCSRRSSGDSMLPDLLAIFSDAITRMNVFIIGATNRPDLLDSALFTPERFGRLMFINVPDFESTKAIWDGLLSHTKHFCHIDTCRLAKQSLGLSGAEITSVFGKVMSKYLSEHIAKGGGALPLITEDFFTTCLPKKHKTQRTMSGYCYKFREEMCPNKFK